MYTEILHQTVHIHCSCSAYYLNDIIEGVPLMYCDPVKGVDL